MKGGRLSVSLSAGALLGVIAVAAPAEASRTLPAPGQRYLAPLG